MMEQTVSQILSLLCSYTSRSLHFSDAWASDAGVCVSDMRALAALDQAERSGCTLNAGQLATELGLSAPATSALISRLEAGDLLIRQADPEDRRRIQLFPTDHARKKAGAFFGPMGEAVLKAADTCSPDELGVIRDFLARTVEQMETCT